MMSTHGIPGLGEVRHFDGICELVLRGRGLSDAHRYLLQEGPKMLNYEDKER